MCGIVGYIGKKQASPILIDGLKKLEYRGYDSAGLVILNNQKAYWEKQVGKVVNLSKALEKDTIVGNIGIAHTRWATHGKPTQANAHPHFDCKREIFVVHNGIIENYQELKIELEKKGHKFVSETDTEVIAHLIEENYKKLQITNAKFQINSKTQMSKLENAVRQSLKKVIGAYGIAIVSTREPDKIIVARNGSPLLVGVGKGENFIASDAAAILASTKKVIYLDDGEIATVTAHKVKITNLLDQTIKKKISTITWNEEQISKGGYKHFMLKEIHEASQVIINSTRGRILVGGGKVKLGGLEQVADKLKNINKIIIVGCGTARNAGLVGEYMLEEFAKISVEVEYASEFRYRAPVIDENTAILAISQSGETADTLAAVREGKKQGALTLGIVNAVGSTIARETDAGVYNHVGPEIAVASTKAYFSQIIILALLTVFLGSQRNLSPKVAKNILNSINNLPGLIKKVFEEEKHIEKIAEKYKKYSNFLYLGRRYNYPTAEEGALKLKEISYLHAEGYPTGEMKHGPIAMITPSFPSVIIAPNDSVYEKNLSGIEEIKARNGKIIALTTAGDKKITRLADEVIYLPKCLELLSPILSSIALHLLAYYIGVGRGYNVDQPRNLAKSVTVE